jgi:hypothetical protein
MPEPPEHHPDPERWPDLARLLGTTLLGEELWRRRARRELAQLLAEERAIALQDMVATFEPMQIPHYHEQLSKVPCAGCWKDIVLEELQARIEALKVEP